MLQYLLYVKPHLPALGSFNSQAFTSIDKWLNSNQVRSPFQETVKMFEGECKATEKYLNSKDFCNKHGTECVQVTVLSTLQI